MPYVHIFGYTCRSLNGLRKLTRTLIPSLLLPASGWHLAWIRVTNMTTGAWSLFPCNQWLARSEGDQRTSRLLDAAEDSNGAPQDAAATATAFVGIGAPRGPVPFTSTLLRKMGGTVGQPGYRIT